LINQEHKIVVLDNLDPYYDVSIKKRNIKSFIEHKNCRFIKGDIRDKRLIDQIFSENKPGLVVHLAAKAGVRPSIANPTEYIDVNIVGTNNILEAMQKTGVKKMIFASSSSVYGNNKKVPFAESDNVDFPISPYAATKKAGELLCHNYHSLYKMDVFCLRFFTVYGPAQRPEMAISLFTNNIINDVPIKMFGDGSSKRDYTYIDDILQGITSSIEKLNGYEIINLGNSDTISLKDLIKTIEKTTGKKAKIDQQPFQKGDVDITCADISKAINLIDYQPNTKIGMGIEKYWKWVAGKK